jgi:hypothetical protein
MQATVGGWDMQAVGPTQLILLLVAVAIIAAVCGFLGSLVMQRKKRRARGYFLVGFLCGATATSIRRMRRRGVRRFAARALTLALPAGRSRWNA